MRRKIAERARCATGSSRCSAACCFIASHSVSSSLPGLSRIDVAHPELADVVQQRGALEPAAPLVAQAQLLGDQVGEQRDALAVAAGVGALGVDHLGEGGGDVVEVVVVDRACCAAPARSAKIVCCRPSERSVSQNSGSRGDARERRRRARGSNQLPERARDFAPRRLDAVRGLEHVDHLRQQGDARIDRDRRAGEAERLAAAVPVLVEIVDAGGDTPRRSASCARSRRRDGSASRSARCAILAAVAEDVDQRAEALGQARLQAGVRQHEAQRLRQAAVDRS